MRGDARISWERTRGLGRGTVRPGVQTLRQPTRRTASATWRSAVKTDLKPLRVAKTYTFRKGEDITVIGNPGIGDGQVLENAISRGVMSTKIKIDNRNFYQLGIAINPGNSGGPVFDSSGRVIGVATLKSSKQEATGFSIPIEDFQEALAKLAKQPSFAADRTALSTG